MTDHVLFLIHIKMMPWKLYILCVDVLVECTKKKVVTGLLDLVHFSDTFYFLLAFYFRILCSYTTDFNPRINKDITIILIAVFVVLLLVLLLIIIVVIIMIIIISTECTCFFIIYVLAGAIVVGIFWVDFIMFT